jgi:hypothetical protein
MGLTLGELGSFAGLLQTIFAPFLGPGVAAEVALHLEGLPVVGRELA